MNNKFSMIYIEEPNLTFDHDQKTADPHDGLMLFGPFDARRVKGIKTIGIVGPKLLREHMKEYLSKLHKPLHSIDEARPSFPGLQAAFGISINFDNIVEVDINDDKLEFYKRFTDNHQRIYNWTNLYFNALETFINEEDTHVDAWIIVIPEYIYQFGRPKSRIPSDKSNIRPTVSKKVLKGQYNPGLFEDINKAEEEMREAYRYEVNFHNQLKAKLLKLKVVTQIIRGRKIIDALNPNLEPQLAKLETAKAWNICTTLYYKLGGLPWKLGDVREKVCYLGLVYKKVDESKEANNACCAAQMFLDSGDGMVFRGNMGPWYNPQTKEYHLHKNDAKALIEKSLEAFYKRFSFYPEQIFIHSRTYFNDEEWAGFEEAAIGKSQLIGVRITERTSIKLFRNGDYCIPRGMMLKMSEDSAYLWSKGFVSRFKTQMGLEVPSPLSIKIIRGKEDIKVVCKDIMSLTKLNYNACIYGDGVPVTLKFADSIGEILTAGKNETTEVLTFKHYI